MSTHPLETFSTSPSSEFMTLFAWDDSTYGLRVWLYDDPTFTNWHADRAAEADTERTTKETGYMDDYSSYTIKMECNISNVNGVVASAGYGCCLRDKSQDGGGYCMTMASNGSSVNTYFLDEGSDWATVLADPYDLSAMPQPSSTYVGITTFYVVDESSGGDFSHWSGYKAQPWPADSSTWDDMYRFEKGDQATGYIYDPGAADSAKWQIEFTRTLNSAVGDLSSLTLTASTLTLLAYFSF